MERKSTILIASKQLWKLYLVVIGLLVGGALLVYGLATISNEKGYFCRYWEYC